MVFIASAPHRYGHSDHTIARDVARRAAPSSSARYNTQASPVHTLYTESVQSHTPQAMERRYNSSNHGLSSRAVANAQSGQYAPMAFEVRLHKCLRSSRARILALGIADHMHCLMTRRRMTVLRLCKVRIPRRLEGADRTFMRGRILGSTRGLDRWAVVIAGSSNFVFVLYFHRQSLSSWNVECYIGVGLFTILGQIRDLYPVYALSETSHFLSSCYANLRLDAYNSGTVYFYLIS